MSEFLDRKNQFLPLLARAGLKYGLEPEYLVSIARIESAFNPNAMVLSGPDGERGGAYGLCQITYKTAEALGFMGDPKGLLYPDVNVEYAALLTVQNRERVGPAILDLAACHNSGKPYDKAPHAAQQYARNVQTFCMLYRVEARSIKPL